MKTKFKIVSGAIVAPKGFRASGVFCDIKRIGTGKGSNKGAKRDLALIVSDRPATVAGMFTTNQVCAAPVKVCLERVKRGKAQAVVVNSGNANACTGGQGLADAREMARFTERSLRLPGGSVLVGSTGRIGMALPMDNVRAGIIEAAVELGDTARHAANAVEAIMTSDTRPKEIAVELKLNGRAVRIGGICKGAGMIQPGMSASGRRPAARSLHATMLCFLTTDAAVPAAALQAALEEAVAQSFNRITVDGDMSTNDMLMIQANGLASNPAIKDHTEEYQLFVSALEYVLIKLAKMIARDGEGATKLIEVLVTGATSEEEAVQAGRAVANSNLVKTAIHGADANWGRILAAVGYSGIDFNPDLVEVSFNDLPVLKKNYEIVLDEEKAKAILTRDSVVVHINLNQGTQSARFWTCDLTKEYVHINASYRS